MSNFKRNITNLILKYQIPQFYNRYLYETARLYTSFYKGEGNADMRTNGEYRFLEDLLAKKINTVFDVGANVGEYTDYLLELDDVIDVHCFDPSKEAFEILKKKGYGENVHLNNVAMSDVVSRKYLYQEKGKSPHSSFYKIKDGRKKGFRTKVTTITLDSYCKKNKIEKIDLLKIDTEGHELAVLNGAVSMLSKGRVDIIQFEFGYAAVHARVTFKDFVDLFLRYKYAIYKIKPLTIEKVRYTMEMEHSTYANFLAVRKGLHLRL